MSITFIIFVALAVVLSGYSRRRQASLGGQPVEESDGAESAPSFDRFSDDGENVSERPAAFAYESDVAGVQPPSYRPTPRRQDSVVVRPLVADDPEPVRFDLRQAVISQVILSNPYNREINQ